MIKTPTDKNSAPEHVVGRTGWDLASETLSFVRLQASLIALVVILLGLSAGAIYMFYAKMAEQQQETIKRLHESGKLLNETHETMKDLRSSQIKDLENLFHVTREATSTYQQEQAKVQEEQVKATRAKVEAAAAETKMKEATAQAAEAAAKVKEATAKVAEVEAKATEATVKAKRATDSLAEQASTLTSTQRQLDQVKVSVSELADSIRDENWPKVASQLDSLFKAAGSSFDRRQIEQALRNLKNIERPDPSLVQPQSGLDASLIANPIAPPKIERQLSPTLIAQIQRTLCIKVDGLIGDEDSDTRSALSQFYEGYDYDLLPDEPRRERGRKGAKVRVLVPLEPIPPPNPLRANIDTPAHLEPAPPEPLPYIIDTSERLTAISAAVDKFEGCNKHGFKSAFEVGLFAHFAKERISNVLLKATSLAKIPVQKAGKEWTNSEMRSAVRKLREKYGLDSGVGGSDADAIDSDLLDMLREVAQPTRATEKIAKVERPRFELHREFFEILDPYDPEVHSASFVSSLQRAMCVPKDEIGTPGPNTKALIEIFEVSPHTKTNNNGKLDPNEISADTRAGSLCAGGGRNFFEKLTYPLNDPDGKEALVQLIVALNKVPGGNQLATTMSLDDIRDRISQVRADPTISPKLKQLPPALSNQVTRDLLLALPR
jgi:hypothetical protein